MKKIFSFVCALVCAMSLNAAKTIYLNTGGSDLWEQAGAVFVEDISDKDMTAVEGAFGYYQVSIDDSQTKVKFLRMKGDKSQQWNATAELTIPTDGNDCYTITGWNENEGNWSKYKTPDPVDPSSVVYSIKHPWKDGQDASWSYKDLTPNGDGTYSIRDIYGGKGCNWKSTVSSEKWVGTPTLVGEPAVGDSAIFTLTSTSGDGAITITKISSTTGGEGGEGGEGGDTPDPAATYGIGSNLNNWTPSANPMTVTDGVATCTIALGTEDFKFSVVENGTWLKNLETTITRANNTMVLSAIDSYDNCVLTPDVAGDYVFNFTIETKTLVVVFPAQVVTGMQEMNTTKDFVKVIRDGQVLIVREGVTYNLMGQIIQ